MSRLREEKPLSFICSATNVLSKSACSKLITAFESDSQHQEMGRTMGGQMPKTKDSTDIMILPEMDNWQSTWQSVDTLLHQALAEPMQSYIKRYHELEGYELADSGYLMQRYSKGKGRYHWHVDAGGGNTKSRMIAVILYLNDVKRGGETEFLYHKLKVKPEAGKILLFPPFWNYPHRGNVPLSEDKYILTTFGFTRS